MPNLFFRFILLLLISGATEAKEFKSSFVQFELPANWECKLKVSTWNCHHKRKTLNQPAIIVLAAKEAGNQDTFANYRAKLQSKPGLSIENNKNFQLKNVQIKERMINGQKWLDGLSYNREAPNYYTRYLATIKNKLAILVTFTSHKSQYTLYLNDFNQAIASLKALKIQKDDPSLNSKTTAAVQVDHGEDKIEFVDEDTPDFLKGESSKSEESLFTPKNLMIGAAALLVLVVLFLK